MVTILSMPKWGLAMKSGLVVEWLKKQGETVQQGEPIVEIESEKATNEVEAPATGVLRSIVVAEGDSTAVSEPIAIIAAPDEQLSDEQVAALLREDAEARRQKAEALSRPRTTQRTSQASTPTLRATTGAGGRVNASPAARRLAQELGVDLATVTGTGPGGMIGREDVQRAAASTQVQEPGEAVEEKTVEVDGIATHVLLAGPINAPHIVFIHGLGGSLTTWSLNLPAFAERYHICALDLVGAGDSDKPEREYSVNALADFLAHALDSFGSDWQHTPLTLVGHSLGGAIALAFAERYPERTERLVLVDSAGLGPEINAVVLDLMHEQPTPEHIRAELTYFFAQPSMVQQALVDQLYRQRTQPGAHKALLATSDAAFKDGQQRIDLSNVLAQFSKPVLVIWGDKDAVIPVAHAPDKRQGEQDNVEIFANCGHCPHIEQAAAFNQRMQSFLG